MRRDELYFVLYEAAFFGITGWFIPWKSTRQFTIMLLCFCGGRITYWLVQGRKTERE